MSTDLKLRALELAVAATPSSGGADVVTVASKFFAFLTDAQGAVAGKPAKTTPVKEAPAKDVPVAEAKIETPKEPEVLTVTQDQVKQGVIDLVNAGNKAAGNDKAGREYAAAVLAPFGAKNVSTNKPEDYAKVLEALKAKVKAIEEEAALTG